MDGHPGDRRTGDKYLIDAKITPVHLSVDHILVGDVGAWRFHITGTE
jgi:hypothetical protein